MARRATATATASGRRERRAPARGGGRLLACPLLLSLLLLQPFLGPPLVAGQSISLLPPDLIPAQPPPPPKEQGAFFNGLAAAAAVSASSAASSALSAASRDGGSSVRAPDSATSPAANLLDPQLRVLDGARERLERAAAEAAARPGTAGAAAALSELAGQVGALRRQLAGLPAAWGLGGGDEEAEGETNKVVDFRALLPPPPPPNVTAASLPSWLGAKGGFGDASEGGTSSHGGPILSSFQDAAWLCYNDPFACWKRYGPVESGALKAALQAEAVRGVEAAAAGRSRQLRGALDWAAYAAAQASLGGYNKSDNNNKFGNASLSTSSLGLLKKKNANKKRARVAASGALDALLGPGGDAALDAAVGALAALAAADAVVAFGEARVAAAVRVASLLLPVRVALNPRAVVGQTLQLVIDAARTGFRPASLFPFQTDGRVNNFQELAVASAEAAVDGVTSGLNAVLAGFDAAARRWWRAPRGGRGRAGDEALAALAAGPGGAALRALLGAAAGGDGEGRVPAALLPALEEGRRAVEGVKAAAAAAAAAQNDDGEEEQGSSNDDGAAGAAAGGAAAASDDAAAEDDQQPSSLPPGLSALVLRAASSSPSSAAATTAAAAAGAAAARRPLTDELRLTLGVAGDLFVEWARASARDLQRAIAAFDAAVPGPSPAEAVKMAREALGRRGESAKRALERAFPSADALEAAEILRVSADEILAAAEEAAALAVAPDAPAVLAARDALAALARGMRFAAGPLGSAADAVFSSPPPLANATLSAVRALSQEGADEVDAAAARVRADYAPEDLARLGPEALLKAARRAVDGVLGGAADAASSMVAALLERATAGGGRSGGGGVGYGAEQARALADGLPDAMQPLVRAFGDALSGFAAGGDAAAAGGGGGGGGGGGAPARRYERQRRAWEGAAAALDGRAGAELRALAGRIASLAEAVPVAQDVAAAGQVLRQRQEGEAAPQQQQQQQRTQQQQPPLGAGVAAAAALLEAAAAGRVSDARAALQGALMRLNAENVEAEAEDKAAAAAAAAAEEARKAATAAAAAAWRAAAGPPPPAAADDANDTQGGPSLAARLNVVLTGSADQAVRLSRSALERGAQVSLLAQGRGATALRAAAAEGTRAATAVAAGLQTTVAPAVAAFAQRRRAAADAASLGVRESLSPVVKEGVRLGERVARGWLDAALTAVGVGGVGGGGGGGGSGGGGRR